MTFTGYCSGTATVKPGPRDLFSASGVSATRGRERMPAACGPAIRGLRPAPTRRPSTTYERSMVPCDPAVAENFDVPFSPSASLPVSIVKYPIRLQALHIVGGIGQFNAASWRERSWFGRSRTSTWTTCLRTRIVRARGRAAAGGAGRNRRHRDRRRRRWRGKRARPADGSRRWWLRRRRHRSSWCDGRRRWWRRQRLHGARSVSRARDPVATAEPVERQPQAAVAEPSRTEPRAEREAAEAPRHCPGTSVGPARPAHVRA